MNPPTVRMSDFLSVPAVARQLHLSRATVYRMISEGKLTAGRHGAGGGRFVIAKTELQRYLSDLGQSSMR